MDFFDGPPFDDEPLEEALARQVPDDVIEEGNVCEHAQAVKRMGPGQCEACREDLGRFIMVRSLFSAPSLFPLVVESLLMLHLPLRRALGTALTHLEPSSAALHLLPHRPLRALPPQPRPPPAPVTGLFATVSGSRGRLEGGGGAGL